MTRVLANNVEFVQEAIGRMLRILYAEGESQPIPDRLARLLRQLDPVDPNNPSSDPGKEH